MYGDETAVLTDLTGRQMESLLTRLAKGGGGLPAETVNPAFDQGRFDALWRE